MILEGKSLKRNISEQGKSELKQICKGRIRNRSILERTSMKKANHEHDKSEIRQIVKNMKMKHRKRTNLQRMNLTKGNPEEGEWWNDNLERNNLTK